MPYEYGTFESCEAGCRKSLVSTAYIGILTDDVGRVRWESLLAYETPREAIAVACEHRHTAILRAHSLLWSEV